MSFLSCSRGKSTPHNPDARPRSIDRLLSGASGDARRAFSRFVERTPDSYRPERACKPGSVTRRWRVRGHLSGTMVSHRLKRPTRGSRTGSPRTSPYLALLRVGFTKPARSPGLLVRSYRTVSPLPRLSGAVCFLWHFPEGHPWWTLSTTLPCGARTFLPQTMLRAAAQPTPVDIFILSRLP